MIKLIDEKKLDNPVWFSLTESHRQLALNFGGTKFFHPDYCPFGGFTERNSTSDAISAYSLLDTNFFIVGEKPLLPSHLKINKELVCLQMILPAKPAVELDQEIIPLHAGHQDLLYQLVNLVQPGYFKKKTFLLGDYFGIFKNGQLIAVSGERMKTDAFTEVSAIVTHPEHTGKGYAKQLTAYCVNNVINQSKIPFLHVVENNTGAIALYAKLGFVIRRKISFWNIVNS